MRGVRHKWIRALFLIGMFLIVAAFLVLDPLLRSWRKRDQAGAVPQYGIARVEIRVLPPPNTIGFEASPQVSVRFRGHLYSVKSVPRASALAEGRDAEIVYHVGKSGDIYVDSAEPLNSPAPPPSVSPQHN